MKTATYYRVTQRKADGGYVVSWFDKLSKAEKWIAERPGCEAPIAVPVVKYRGGFSPVEPSRPFGA